MYQHVSDFDLNINSFGVQQGGISIFCYLVLLDLQSLDRNYHLKIKNIMHTETGIFNIQFILLYSNYV